MCWKGCLHADTASASDDVLLRLLMAIVRRERGEEEKCGLRRKETEARKVSQVRMAKVQ